MASTLPSVIPGLNYTTELPLYVGNIAELDMKSAGLNVIKQEKLLPDDVIATIDALPKKQQSVYIGRLAMKEFKGLSLKITEGIRNRVNEFVYVNNIQSEDIVSIKRDAVFVKGKMPSTLRLQNGTVFTIKSAYTVFAKLPGKELYAAPRKRVIDVKGIGSDRLEYHRGYMLEFLLDILGMIERNNIEKAAETLQLFKKEYVELKLPPGFYREFNTTSGFTRQYGSSVFSLEGDNEAMDISNLLIHYNLKNVIFALAAYIA